MDFWYVCVCTDSHHRHDICLVRVDDNRQHWGKLAAQVVPALQQCSPQSTAPSEEIKSTCSPHSFCTEHARIILSHGPPEEEDHHRRYWSQQFRLNCNIQSTAHAVVCYLELMPWHSMHHTRMHQPRACPSTLYSTLYANAHRCKCINPLARARCNHNVLSNEHKNQQQMHTETLLRITKVRIGIRPGQWA